MKQIQLVVAEINNGYLINLINPNVTDRSLTHATMSLKETRDRLLENVEHVMEYLKAKEASPVV